VSDQDQWNRLLSSLKKDDFSGEKNNGDGGAAAEEGE